MEHHELQGVPKWQGIFFVHVIVHVLLHFIILFL